MAAIRTVALPFLQLNHSGCFPEFQFSNTEFQNPDALPPSRARSTIRKTRPLDKGTRTFNKETRTVGKTPPAHDKEPPPCPNFGPAVDKMARTVAKERRTVTVGVAKPPSRHKVGRVAPRAPSWG